MPYEISFSRRVPIADREKYINECCIGGDAVVDRLLPVVRSRYTHIQTNQEDWGWFIWFQKGKVRLAIDIVTDDPEEGAFRIHLTSRTRRWLVLDQIRDSPELEEVRALVMQELTSWAGPPITVTPLDRNYM